MSLVTGRRMFLKTVAGVAGGLASLSRAGFGQTAPTPIAVARLSDTLIEITGAGANVMVLSSPEGLLMVDGGLPERSAELLKVIASQPGAGRVQVLINTQWHSDHTGSNEALGQAGTKIIAHQNTKRWLGARVFRESINRTFEPRPAYALPTETITRRAKMTFGTEAVEYGPLPPSHTNGDLYVFFPRPNILVTSDALNVGRYPSMDYSTGGWIGGMIDATTELLAIGDASTRLVPGLGPMQTKSDLKAEHDMLVVVKDRVQSMIRQGKSLQEVVAAAPTKELDATWGAPDRFLAETYVGLVRHTHELGGIL